MSTSAPVVFHGAMRAGAGASRGRRLPLVVLGVELEERARGDEAELLQRDCVEVGTQVHPLLDAVLTRAGCVRRGRGSYTARLDRPEELSAMLGALPPACVRGPEGSRSRRAQVAALGELLGALSGVEAEVAALLGGAGERRSPAQRAASAWAVVSVGRGQLQLRVLTEELGLEVGDTRIALRQLDLRSGSRLRCAPGVAEVLIAAAAERGIVAAELGARPRWAQLRQLGEIAVLAEEVAGAPALARLSTPAPPPAGEASGGQGRSTRELGAAEALGEIAMRHLSAPLVLDPHVLEAADIAVAGPAGRRDLHPYQDHFVSCYLASARGMVNALEPGMGKTVCAAAALAERAEQAEAARVAHRSLVVAPAGLRTQWHDELGRFHPRAVVHLCTTSVELGEAVQAVSAARSGAHVVVCSPELITRARGSLPGLMLDDVVLDEAAVLRSAGARRDALWQLRSCAQRALALTGTPVERDVADLGQVLAWALGTDREYPRAVSARHLERGAAELLEGMGDTVFRRARHLLGAQMPEVALEHIRLTPTPEEAEVLAAAAAHVRAASARVEREGSASARGTLLAAVSLARAASCDPASLSASQCATLGVARDLAPGGTKRNWLLASCTEARGVGRQSLVTCDVSEAAVGVHALLVATGLEARLLSGRSDVRERAGMIAAFQAGEVEVLVLTSVGRLGLNLQAARSVVSYDVPPTVAAARQRVARAARIGAEAGSVSLAIPVLRGGCEDALAEELLPRLRTSLGAPGAELEVGRSASELTLEWARTRE